MDDPIQFGASRSEQGESEEPTAVSDTSGTAFMSGIGVSSPNTSGLDNFLRSLDLGSFVQAFFEADIKTIEDILFFWPDNEVLLKELLLDTVGLKPLHYLKIKKRLMEIKPATQQQYHQSAMPSYETPSGSMKAVGYPRDSVPSISNFPLQMSTVDVSKDGGETRMEGLIDSIKSNGPRKVDQQSTVKVDKELIEPSTLSLRSTESVYERSQLPSDIRTAQSKNAGGNQGPAHQELYSIKPDEPESKPNEHHQGKQPQSSDDIVDKGLTGDNLQAEVEQQRGIGFPSMYFK
ncbi:hypothetical protein BC936DRAFT_148818 [Jimgerdemannia flammicorona]|uniref:Uncharacterized protein n=1 Tax=Jimgerdemannia flammicorona TaxID=994334 RepID=A0A433D281_9FUNG|nr:hypothetical protein BC936DRAFT_148818 [Jimgerdemannia flammicorona]